MGIIEIPDYHDKDADHTEGSGRKLTSNIFKH